MEVFKVYFLKALKKRGIHVTQTLCLTLCRQHNSDSVHDKRRLAIVTLLDKFYNIVETEGRYLSEKSKQELPFMGIYYQLSLEAVQMRLRRWKFAPKFNLFQHLCELQMVKFGNGRFYWTYSDEDLQRILKNIAVRNHSSTVAWMTLYRYAIWFLIMTSALLACGCSSLCLCSFVAPKKGGMGRKSGPLKIVILKIFFGKSTPQA